MVKYTYSKGNETPEKMKGKKKMTTYMQIIKENGKALTPVIRNTEKGQSDYANKAWRKYGDGVTVEQYHFDEQLNIITDCIWHA